MRLATWAALVGLLIAARATAADWAEVTRPTDALYRYDTAIGGIVIYCILLLILIWIGRGLPKREFFALRRPASWPNALGLALAVVRRHLHRRRCDSLVRSTPETSRG